MLDFYQISERSAKRGVKEIYPEFIINNNSSDLMIRGGDFYAVWLEDRGLWSTNEQDLIDLIDNDLDIYARNVREKTDDTVKVLHMKTSSTGMIDRWHKYCQRQCRDSFHMLDEKLIFSNAQTTKKDYASKSLPYPLEESPTPGYDKLIGTLYSPEERAKIEWAIGSIVAGDSKKIQKFVVLYGSAGTGKSTILNIIQMLFDGYYSTFDAKALGSSSNVFALEAFKTNPLVAIQHDGDLSRIEDNTRLNSLVSHELMTVNEKFKSTYTNRFKSFLFMGTNKPVRITDAKSGLIRRLIDVSPTGNTVPVSEYRRLMKQIEFELGGIAWHCLEVYKKDPGIYDNYIPVSMMGASNDFYNYILDHYYDFKDSDSTTLLRAWSWYKEYCEDAKVPYPMTRRVFGEELKNYFEDFEERTTLDDGTRVRNYYTKFKTSIFTKSRKNSDAPVQGIIFRKQKSVFDSSCKDCLAQYASEKETPSMKWADVTTTLKDIDTSQLHYVKIPTNHIVIDFDIKDESGNKSLERNLIEANKWPPTYAELSKSGQGIHLHYIYLGDVDKVKPEYDKNIEIKIFRGKSSLRRLLTKCNDLPIATISSGLPLKEEVKKEKQMVNFSDAEYEKGLVNSIKKALNKEVHPGTKPSIDWIKKILDDAYESGRHYDVENELEEAVIDFARHSTNHRDYCLKLVREMKFKSEDISESKENGGELVFYDVEVFPNLFLVNWKVAGEGRSVARMINPTPEQIEELLQFKLVGFNCRRYDNHILYARWQYGYSNEQLYDLSQRIVSGDRNAFFGGAYNLSYTDVYDFSSKKQSLKKFEVELGIHHKELGLPWDQPVPENMWTKVAEYCDNDVLATEAVFNDRHADFVAREILADVAGMSVNDTTNSLTTKIIFGDNRNPQSQFNYRNLGEYRNDVTYIFPSCVNVEDDDAEYSLFDKKGRPIFKGYIFDQKTRVSTYRGEEVGEGGYVYAEPGMYGNVALLDIASMHPSSIVAEKLFGDEYTQRFKDILDARIAIKHGEFDKAKKMLGGKLAKYLTDEKAAKDLAQALKIAINSVYGLTAAHFQNPFADPRNVDNIVAKRGALFMVNLKHEVQKRGFTVAHIKTDSIKIPDATPEIIKFVMDYGKEYGYTFEHEATYDRMCLVNDAVYIAKYKDGGWTATGTQFAVPYVFKTLFSKEPIIFEDLCETKEVKKGSLYLDMNERLPNVEGDEKEYEKTVKHLKGLDPNSQKYKDESVYLERLSKQIEKGHNYIFIGRVGNFCPIKEGGGGGYLYRMQDGKYYAAAGTKGYRWLESETVKTLGKEDCIDEEYYKTLVSEAVQTLIAYGDYSWFISDRPYKPPKFEDGHPVYPEAIPFMNEPEE